MNIERAEVFSENTIPGYHNSAEDKDNMMISLFLDFLTKSVTYKPESLVPYALPLGAKRQIIYRSVSMSESD